MWQKEHKRDFIADDRKQTARGAVQWDAKRDSSCVSGCKDLSAMRDLLLDWNHWSAAERMVAVAVTAALAVGIPFLAFAGRF